MRRARAALALCGLTLACATPPELERAWQQVRESLEPPAPPLELKPEPAAGLPSPEGLRAESGALRAVRLEWEPVLAADVGGYAVERAFDRDGPFERIAAVEGRFATVYVDRAGSANAGTGAEALGDGTTAFYRVRAFAPSGHLAATTSDVAIATTAPAPAPPADLRAYSHQPRMVPLSWRASDDRTVVGYVIDRSPSSRGPFEQIAELEGRDAIVYDDEGLGDLRVFYYRLAAVNAAGAIGDPSEPVRAVTKPEPLPPYQLQVAEQRLGANRVEWDPNVEPDLVGYRLMRQREGGGAPEVVTSLPPDETSAEDAALAADEEVSYTVVAVDRDGLESSAAAPLVVESEGYALVASATPNLVVLTWKQRADEGWERARVLRRRRLRTRDLGVVEGSEFVDADVSPGARYRYTVVLERGAGVQAPPSTPVEVVVPEY